MCVFAPRTCEAETHFLLRERHVAPVARCMCGPPHVFGVCAKSSLYTGWAPGGHCYAQFTQDAEHLATHARKLWNTLWSMGVFTQLASNIKGFTCNVLTCRVLRERAFGSAILEVQTNILKLGLFCSDSDARVGGGGLRTTVALALLLISRWQLNFGAAFGHQMLEWLFSVQTYLCRRGSRILVRGGLVEF